MVTTAGKAVTGRMIEDGPERIVLQVSSGKLERVTLPRSDIEQIVPSKLSAMPDNLVDQLAGREQFLDLVPYMMELAAADKTPAAHGHLPGGKTSARNFRASSC